MKKMLVTASAVLLVFAAHHAVAGDCGAGFGCDNECPLAQQANSHRSFGREGVASAPTVRAALVAEVARNLSRV